MATREVGWVALLAVALGVPASSAGAVCQRADFEAAVGEAAEALRNLNQTNKPAFQGKLRQLKTKRGWSHDQFLAEAAPIVQDTRIAAYDEQAAAFLSKIERLGAEGTAAEAPDCARLEDVRQSMRALVEVQNAKWSYMFERIATELSR